MIQSESLPKCTHISQLWIIARVIHVKNGKKVNDHPTVYRRKEETLNDHLKFCKHSLFLCREFVNVILYEITF